MRKSKHFFWDIDWSNYIPPENFYFFNVSLTYRKIIYSGLVYMPYPETKKDHFQKPTKLELTFPKINYLEYGIKVEVVFKRDQLHIITN